MKNIINALTTYGFQKVAYNTYAKGIGSISAGALVTVEIAGAVAKVELQTYFCNGEVEEDTCQTWTCWLADLWAYLPGWAFR